MSFELLSNSKFNYTKKSLLKEFKIFFFTATFFYQYSKPIKFVTLSKVSIKSNDKFNGRTSFSFLPFLNNSLKCSISK